MDLTRKIAVTKKTLIAQLAVTLLALFLSAFACAQTPAAWNQPQKPFQIYGDTYYVGTHGLSSILITSKEGHILIDGALPDSPPLIIDNIRALGFRIEDVKLILNTHVHFDHAGGIAQLQKLSGAVVAASAATARVLQSGAVDKDDPQFSSLPAIPAVAHVKVFNDGEKLKVGSLTVTAHLTPGHTPGGTSWTWQSCENEKCFQIVYADSLNPIADKFYRYTDNKRDPNGVQQLEKSFAALNTLPCDILLAPHPELAGLFDKLAKRGQGENSNPFVDAKACEHYVDVFREKLKARIAEENTR